MKTSQKISNLLTAADWVDRLNKLELIKSPYRLGHLIIALRLALWGADYQGIRDRLEVMSRGKMSAESLGHLASLGNFRLLRDEQKDNLRRWLEAKIVEVETLLNSKDLRPYKSKPLTSDEKEFIQKLLNQGVTLEDAMNLSRYWRRSLRQYPATGEIFKNFPQIMVLTIEGNHWNVSHDTLTESWISPETLCRVAGESQVVVKVLRDYRPEQYGVLAVQLWPETDGQARNYAFSNGTKPVPGEILKIEVSDQKHLAVVLDEQLPSQPFPVRASTRVEFPITITADELLDLLEGWTTQFQEDQFYLEKVVGEEWLRTDRLDPNQIINGINIWLYGVGVGIDLGQVAAELEELINASTLSPEPA